LGIEDEAAEWSRVQALAEDSNSNHGETLLDDFSKRSYERSKI
jgi:hypothetical protein